MTRPQERWLHGIQKNSRIVKDKYSGQKEAGRCRQNKSLQQKDLGKREW
jgi:hypothetical protein